MKGVDRKRLIAVGGASLVLVVGAIVAFASSDGGEQNAQAPLQELHLDLDQVPRGSRAQLIVAADRAALLAETSEKDEAARLRADAAQLREASYLSEGKKLDALEALELWGQSSDDQTGCERALRLIRLRSHLQPDPGAQYRDLYLVRMAATDDLCRERVERAMAVISAYRPDEQELARLRQEAEKGRKEKSGVDASGQQEVEGHHAHVVVPELQEGLNQATEISRLEPFGAEQTARVVVHVTHPTKFRVGTVEATSNQGPRLFVDIEHASYSGPAVHEMTGVVERVRLGKQKDATRIVFDLTKAAHHRIFYLPDPFRLVCDLSVQAPDQLTQPREIRRVVLDPGHGGSDPGAVGPNGLREKDVTLDIAHRAAPLLAREAGVSTLLTRDVDVYVPLDVRAAKANAFHADLFISIHANSSEDSQSRGIMSFVLDASRDDAAARIAARENASTEAAAAELANSLSRIESVDRRAASELFAKMLQRSAGVSLRQRYGEIEDHGVRRAGFYVLAGAAMPAVLFESSFISNPAEAQRLNSDDYRQRLADSIVNAVRAYREGL